MPRYGAHEWAPSRISRRPSHIPSPPRLKRRLGAAYLEINAYDRGFSSLDNEWMRGLKAALLVASVPLGGLLGEYLPTRRPMFVLARIHRTETSVSLTQWMMGKGRRTGLEVWPESHWPGFALRHADVLQSYTA